jgi:regulator of protease activity HflC (stomatin/prohibitin superfamily)
MMNEENQTLLKLKRENQKKLLGLTNDLALEEITLQRLKTQSETEQQIRVIRAKQNQDIKLIQAQASKEQAEQRARKQAEQIMADAQAYADAKTATVTARKRNLQLEA